MSRSAKIIISIVAIVGGWILEGFAFTTTLGHPVSTISLNLGLALLLGGIIFLIIALVSRKK